MKKITKMFLIIIAIFMFANVVFAASYEPVEVPGTLHNKVTADLITTRNTISGTGIVGKNIKTYGDKITNVFNVNGGNNVSGGIRVRTVVKVKNGLTYSKQDDSTEAFIMSPKSTVSISTNHDFKEDTNKIKVEWQNWTGNTTFDATFRANNR